MNILREMSHFWIVTLLMFINKQLAVMTSADETPPVMEKSIIHMNITEGRDAILPCMVKTITTETAQKYQVVWVGPEDRVISSSYNILSNDRRYSIVRPFPADWNLRISRVRDRDAGQYQCQLRPGLEQKKNVFVYVQVPPNIFSSDDVIINEQRNLQIFCNVTGKPKPTISWYKDGKALPELKEEILIINNISRYMAGTFTCIATNGVGPSVKRNISVAVQYRPEVSVYTRRIGQYRHKDVILVCMVNENPRGEITWYKEGRRLDSNWKYEIESMTEPEKQREVVLKIRHMQKEDFGEYTCVAQNTLGYDEVSMAVYELVTAPPVTETRNDIATTHAHYGKSDANSQASKDRITGKQGQIVVTDKSSFNNTSPASLDTDKYLLLGCVLFCLHVQCKHSKTLYSLSP